jgi:hypothetical protein
MSVKSKTPLLVCTNPGVGKTHAVLKLGRYFYHLQLGKLAYKNVAVGPYRRASVSEGSIHDGQDRAWSYLGSPIIWRMRIDQYQRE